MKTIHKIVFGDSRDMRELSGQSVHLIITSPPYWQLKDYGDNNQIGFHESYESYVNNLNLVWQECARILHDGCRLCINIGDQFARSVYYGRYKVIPIRTEIIKFCESIGFDYMGAIIWQKVTTTNTTGGASIMGSFPYPRNGILKLDYEFILIFKKYGKPPKIDPNRKQASILTKEEWNQYFAGHWNFPGERQDKHLAMFPVELPRRLIKMFSFVGDTVLDPFLGSGTTSLAAKQLQRHSVGYEINGEFLPIIKRKLGVDETGLFDDVEFKILQQAKREINFKEKIKNVPYVFHDHVKLDRKVDPKKMQFGSKIDKSSNPKEDFYSIKEIRHPDELILSNNLKIKLIGIKPIESKRDEAKRFLYEKTRGQRVFLKFDAMKYDKNNNLMCYLYLKNKTFVNAHLIRSGLVDVELEYVYKFRDRFKKYLDEANT